MPGRFLYAALTCLAACCFCGPAAAGDEELDRVLGVRVEKTRILVTRPDGTAAKGDDLLGAQLVAADETGVSQRIRIDSVESYSSDLTGEIHLYTFSVRDPDTGRWVDFCRPGPSGRKAGFPLMGTWDEKGNHVPSQTEFSVTCTSGAIGKCVMLGYLPWSYTGEGVSLWDYHQACTRLIRADYCGDGRPHTRDGTFIELFDRAGIQEDTREPGLTFEAAWGADGALCVRKTRIPEIATIEDIRSECPDRMKGRIGEGACAEGFDDPDVLIWNRSRDP